MDNSTMNKLAIVGSHPDTRMNAPWDDLSFDIWAINEAVEVYHYPRWTACFQMHRPQNYTAAKNWVDEFRGEHTNHWAWLQKNHGPDKTIWMQEVDERVPNSKKYPLDEIVAILPGADLRWFTSTVSYMLALGLYLGYKEISIYGVELSSNTEYSYQLHNWQYWVGVAKGTGVRINLESGQMHFSDRLYAYEGEVQIEREWFAQRAKSFNGSWTAQENRTAGIKRELEDALANNQHDKVAGLIIALRESCIDAGKHAGKQAEAERYAAREDPISRQEYELRIRKASMDGEGWRAQMYHSGGKAEYVYDVWRENKYAPAFQQLYQFLENHSVAAYNLGAHLGMCEENEEYIKQFDARLTAAGGERARLTLQGVPA